MGWKTLKETYGIEHIVQVVGAQIHIGSGYVSDLLVIDATTGDLVQHEAFPDALAARYHGLLQAPPSERLAALQAEDQFSNSIPVFTETNGVIVEKYCEALGWPNVTHDGWLMYSNRFFENKTDAIVSAKQSAALALKYAQRYVSQCETNLAEAKLEAQARQLELDRLNNDYPTT